MDSFTIKVLVKNIFKIRFKNLFLHWRIKGAKSGKSLVVAHGKCYIGNHSSDGAIIAAGSVVNKNIPERCLAAGVSAKVVKENVSWK